MYVNFVFKQFILCLLTAGLALANTSTLPEPRLIHPQLKRWQRLLDSQTLLIPNHKKTVQEALAWNKRYPNHLPEVLGNAAPFLDIIYDCIKEKNMPPELLFLPVVESAYDPYAFSAYHAAGIWQIIPATATRLGVTQNWWYDGRRDILDSTNAALDYLSFLANRYNGDWLLAVAAYNSGEGSVDRARALNRKRGLNTDFWSLQLPQQTKLYVPRWLATVQLIRELVSQGKLDSLPELPSDSLQKVYLEKQMDLSLLAKHAQIPLRKLYEYNPGYNHLLTTHDYNHHILLPCSNVEYLNTILAELEEHAYVRWEKHHIQAGETLSGIAAQYDMTTSALKTINHMSSDFIQAGQTLSIPHREYRQHLPSKNKKRTSHIHTVKSGESLSTIAQHYGVATKDLVAWNKLTSSKFIHPKQKLKVILDANYFNNLHQARIRPEIIRKINYLSKQQDSASSIADKFSVNVKDLLQFNPHYKDGKNSRLTLYVDVTKQSSRLTL